MNIAPYVYNFMAVHSYPSISSIEDLASNGMVSPLKVIIRNVGMMHFIGFLNNNNAFALKSTQPYSPFKNQLPAKSLIM